MLRDVVLMFLVAVSACSSPTPLPEIAPETRPSPVVTSTASSVTPAVTAPEVAPRAPGQKVPSGAGFALPPKLDVSAITGVGDELFIVADTSNVAAGKVTRITRTGEQLSHRGPGKDPVWIHSYKIGVDSVAVATGPMGAVAVYRGGRWNYRLAPALEGEDIGAAHVTKTGQVYAAGDTHALYLRTGDVWATHRYGMAVAPRIINIAVDAKGTVMLLGAEGFVMSFSGGRFQQVPIQGMGAGALKKPLVASWSDPEASTFWAASGDAIAEINYATKQAKLHATKLFFDPKSIHGAKTKQGTLLAISTFGKVALFDGAKFTMIHPKGAEAVWLDGSKAEVYCATNFRGVVAIDVKHPWLGTGEGKPIR